LSVQHRGEFILPTDDLTADMQFFIDTLGFRLETITPSDDPAIAVLSGHGMRLMLDRHSQSAPGHIRLLVSQGANVAANSLIAPNGTRIDFALVSDTVQIPSTEHAFQIRNLEEGEPWVIGRAGMLYRDLIDGRLGGSIIASHIRIPEGGPVPDMVHYHTIGFQLIYCLAGWVKLVYEDQGPAFILNAGDCVTQPPAIRHRVLESSDNLEVLEIGVPAQHMTTIDHDMSLPNETFAPDRLFSGQVFCHHQRKQAVWQDSTVNGLSVCKTKVASATNRLACVDVVKAKASFKPATVTHCADIHFRFVVKGQLSVSDKSGAQHTLSACDAMVVPPGWQLEFERCSDDLEYIDVTLPGA